MTIVSEIESVVQRKNKITAYVDYYDDSNPDRILKKKCIEGKTIAEIKVKIEDEECKLCNHENVVHKSLKKELDEFCETRKSKVSKI